MENWKKGIFGLAIGAAAVGGAALGLKQYKCRHDDKPEKVESPEPENHKNSDEPSLIDFVGGIASALASSKTKGEPLDYADDEDDEDEKTDFDLDPWELVEKHGEDNLSFDTAEKFYKRVQDADDMDIFEYNGVMDFDAEDKIDSYGWCGDEMSDGSEDDS